MSATKPSGATIIPSLRYRDAHAAIDSLGLGVQPPIPSWGTLLWGRSGSMLPNLVVGLGLLVLMVIALVPGPDEPAATGPRADLQ